MLADEKLEELLTLVSSLDRAALARQFRTYQASFPVDFTDEFLDQLDIERMRHIFVALCLQCQRLPDPSLVAA